MSRCAITGAAAGIGRALALELGAAGHDVLGLDVDRSASEATADELRSRGVEASFLHADLAAPAGAEAAAAELVAAVSANGTLDVLVHNAGINAVGAFAESDLAAQKRVLAINLTAPLILTARLLEAGAVGAGGTIVFVSSLSRFVGYPGAAAYAASKDGLASYARSLSVALAPSRIHVLTVYPGPTRTEHARRHSPAGSSEERRMPPEELARRIRRAIDARRRVLVPGAANAFFATLGHVAPRVAEGAMRKAIFDKLPTGPR
ncbi:MAG: SDR family NAD(P)-dependent oxidoreductase [Planctomycetota bacterium]